MSIQLKGLGLWLAAVALWAQSEVGSRQPLRTPPTEKFTVNLGFRDWGPVVVADATVLGGNQTGAGGLFAVDAATGKRKWAHRPTFNGGTASVSTPPAVAGDTVIIPYAAAYPGAVVALSIATGKELWRGPDPAQDAAVTIHAGLAYILAKDGNLYALDVATGQVKWKGVYANRNSNCASRPLARDGVLYLTGSAEAVPMSNAIRAHNFLFAVDAKTGQERWRYRAEAPYVYKGVCLHQPVLSSDTIYAAGEEHLYAIDRHTGRDRWKPFQIRRPVEGRDRPVDLSDLVDAGSVLIGITPVSLIAFDKNTGQTRWELPGQYRSTTPTMAVAGNVLYFQGSPDIARAASSRGTIHALDLETRTILWSFSRPTREPNWSFGAPAPVDGGLWVASYEAVVKLQ